MEEPTLAKEVAPVDQQADDEELTPAEEKKFGKFLNKFLEEDDTPSGTPTNAPTPTGAAPTVDVAAEINKALDAREGKQKTDGELAKLRVDLDALKPKAKKWHQPWTLFSG